MQETYGEPVTKMLAPALVLAEELHRGHQRKGTTVPYLSHLLAVCSLVLEDGGGVVAASGALLHDAAEDQGGWEALALIGERCGEAVARVVEECSDSIEEHGAPKAPWRERKVQAIADVRHHSEDALLVIAADKLHNARAVLTDLQLLGPQVWDRFNASPQDIIWYHQEMARVLAERLPQSRSVRLLRSTTTALVDLHAAQSVGA